MRPFGVIKNACLYIVYAACAVSSECENSDSNLIGDISLLNKITYDNEDVSCMRHRTVSGTELW